MTRQYNSSELVTLTILRVMGTGGLLAIPAIFFPYSWMNTCHEMLGLGELPNTPIVMYLARSLSAFYAIAAAFLWFISWDIRRHRTFVRLWSIIAMLMGLVLFGIDLTAGLPPAWTYFEGPMILAMGVVLMVCHQKIGVHENQQDL